MLYGLKKITVFLYRCLTLLNRAVRGPNQKTKNFEISSFLFFPSFLKSQFPSTVLIHFFSCLV